MQEIIEEWRTLKENNNYEISNTGKIRNKNTLHELKQRDNGHGYMMVHLYQGNKRKAWYIHRAVALTFIPNPYRKEEVNHLDGNKSNNNLNNLEWCTRSENGKHAYKVGLRTISQEQIEKAKATIMKVNNDPVLREKGLLRAAQANKKKSQTEYMLNSSNQFKPIYCVELKRIFLCARRVEQKLGIKRNTIHKALEKNYSSCQGYHWKHLEKHRFNNYGRT